MIDKTHINDAVICKEDDSVLEASKILRDTQSRHLIVVNKNLFPIGIISAVDINNRIVAEEKDPGFLKAAQIMTKPILTVDISSTYQEAYEKMISMSTYSLPVTENKKLIGILGFNILFKKVCEVQK